MNFSPEYMAKALNGAYINKTSDIVTIANTTDKLFREGKLTVEALKQFAAPLYTVLELAGKIRLTPALMVNPNLMPEDVQKMFGMGGKV